MESNVFYLNRKEIAAIAQKFNLSATDASDYFRKSREIGTEREYVDWVNEIRKYEQDKKLTLADLFR